MSPCMNSCYGSGFDVDSFGASSKNQDVDILGCKEGASMLSIKSEDPDADATEQSSSFGDTFSGSDEGLKINSSDVEVESPLCNQNGYQRQFGGSIRLFKKKKVTAHWRKFISPLMWRCQWLELRMKELQSQALRYDKELAAYTHEKKLQLKVVDLNDSVSRAVPLTSKSFKNPAMKRRKRIRNEDSNKISSYMSNHIVFSYNENKRCETEGHSVDDDFSDQVDDILRGDDDHLWALGFRDGDCSLEKILLDIEALQSRVLKIKANLSQIISINVRDVPLGCKFLGDQPVSSTQSPSSSLGNDGHQLPVGVPNTPTHNASEYEMDDMVLPGSAVSSFGDAPDIDILESTIGLLSGADGPLNPNQLQDLCKADSDDILISNHAADEQLQNFEVCHVREKSLQLATIKEPNSDDESTTPAPSPAPAPAPTLMILEPAGEAPEGELLSAPQQLCHTTKRRGRKPKWRRSGWLKSERLKKDSDDILINNQAADEQLQNFEVCHVREKSLQLATIKEPNSDDESTTPAPSPAPAPAPALMVLEPAGEAPEGELLSAPQQLCHTTKRRGRKPKRRRSGGLKSERLKKDSDDILISNQAADEQLQNFEVCHVREKSLQLATIKEPNSDDESTTPAPSPAPALMVLEPGCEAPEGELLSAPQLCHTTKRRGRKPKRRRSGGLKSERLKKVKLSKTS